MPLGLIRNRLAVPSTPKVPRIVEELAPVTRVRMFSTPGGLAK
jgi:hypothetical protein